MRVELQVLEPFARRNHGLVTRRVATSAGISRSAWYRALGGGVLEPLHAGVARVVGHAPTREQRILAAVLALSHVPEPPSIVVASHRSAAALLGLDRPPSDPIDVIVSAGHRRQLEGVVIHRPVNLEDLRPTWRDGVPCTNELRTLVDLGAVDPAAVAGAFDRFTVSRRLTPAVVSELLLRHGVSGRAGVAALRAAVMASPLGERIPDSELEIAMANLLRSSGLPPARFHASVAGFEVDFLIEGTRVVIECDGWTTHVANRDQWEFDLDRDARLHIAGYTVLRRSRRQVVFEPERTASLIARLVDRRVHGGGVELRDG